MSKFQKTRVSKVAKTALLILATGAMFSVVVALPGVAQLIPIAEEIFGKESYDKSYNNARALSRLIKERKISVKNRNGKYFLELTPEGEKALGRAKTQKIIPKKWDKKWRLVSFDVYEKLRSRRDQFRTELKEYGFIQLQKSLWIYPHPCEEFIALLRTDHHFGKNIRYIVAAKVDNDTDLRKFFKLT